MNFAPPVRRLVLRDPLDPLARELAEIQAIPAGTALMYCPPELFDAAGLVVVHNGRALAREAAQTASVRAGDSLVFGVALGGKNAGLAIGAVALVAGIGILTGGFGLLGAAPAGGSFLSGLGIGTTLFGGATVLNSVAQLLFAPRVKLDTPTLAKGLDASPTYQIEGVTNTYLPGTPIAIPYGTHRVGGHLVQQYLEVGSDGKSVLKMLMSLGAGPIEAIGGLTVDTDGLTGETIPDSIELNGSPAKNFKGVRVSVRLGTFNQSPILGFNEVVTSQSAGLSTLAYTSPQTLTTTTAVEAFQVNLYFPTGLYNTTTTGQKQNYTVSYIVRWREAGTDTWYGTDTVAVTKNQAAAFSVAYRKNAPMGSDAAGAPLKRVLEVQVERLTVDDSSVTLSFPVSTLQWNTLNEIVSGNLAYPGIALVGFELTATDQLQGSVPTPSVVRNGRKVPVWDGVSTTSPTIAYKYTDGYTQKDNATANADSWTALRSAVGPPITNEKISFQFRQSGTRQLNLVAFKLRKASSTSAISGNLYVQIEGDTAGAPDGVAAATSANVAANTVTTAGGLVYFAFATPATLTADATYHAVLYGTYTASATVNIEVAGQTVSTVSGLADFEYYTNPTWTSLTSLAVVGKVFYEGQRPGENPAWILLDFLTNSLWGLGAWVTLDDIDLTSLLAWAEYCDECYDSNGGTLRGPRWALGLNVDFEASAWELALKIAGSGRATLVRVGRKIYVVIDKPASPTQLFSEGNIIRDSLRLTWLSAEDRPNRVEVQYRNEEIGYNSDVAVKEDPDSLNDGDAYRSETINAFGITAAWRAYRVAKYRVNSSKTIKRTVSFAAPIDAAAILPGDVFSIQHPVQAAASQGGRVIADVSGGTPTVINLDRNANLSWTNIKVRTKGTGSYIIQSRDVSSVASTSYTDTDTSAAEVTVTSAFDGGDLPQAGDPYVCMTTSTVTQDYRCVAMKIAEDFSKTDIVGIQYDATIYNDDPGAIETFTDELPNPLDPDDAEDVENLTLREVHQASGDGSLRSCIEVAFDKPRGWNCAEVWIRPAGVEGGWTHAGNTFTSGMLIDSNVEPNTGYVVAVVAVTRAGAKGAVDDAPSASIFTNDPWGYPNDVTGFTAQIIGGHLILKWAEPSTASPTINGLKDAAAPGAIAGYELRQGQAWATARVMTSLVTGDSFMSYAPPEGTWKYWIRAQTRSGVQSRNPTSVTLTVGDTYGYDPVSRDEQALAFAGTKTNCSIVYDNRLGADGASATYQLPDQTGFSLARYRTSLEIDALPYDTVETVAEHEYTVGSTYASRRLVSGWRQNAFDQTPISLSDSDMSSFTIGGFFGRHYTPEGPKDVEYQHGYQIQYALSTDGGGSYGSWTEFDPGQELVFNGIRFRVLISGNAAPVFTAPQQRSLIYGMKTLVTSSPMMDWGAASLAAGGSTVTFNVAFPAAPKALVATIRNASAGYNVVVSGLSATQFTGRVITDAGAGVATTIYWLAIL